MPQSGDKKRYRRQNLTVFFQTFSHRILGLVIGICPQTDNGIY